MNRQSNHRTTAPFISMPNKILSKIIYTCVLVQWYLLHYANNEIEDTEEKTITDEKYDISISKTDKVLCESQWSEQEKNVMAQKGRGWHCGLYASEVVTINIWHVQQKLRQLMHLFM
jgi:hypothetical protein